MPPLKPIFFRNCHYCGKGALCFYFNIAKVFIQGTTMPPLQLKIYFCFFWNYYHCGKRALFFCVALAKQFQGAPCHPYTQNFFCFFWNCHYCWNEALCFCFDLDRVFLKGDTMPPLQPKVF